LGILHRSPRADVAELRAHLHGASGGALRHDSRIESPRQGFRPR
jgi:hypothetical protein